MTGEPQEWRSGDVVVTCDPAKGIGASYWRVSMPSMDHPAFVLKAMFRDPQKLAEFIASQRPEPRYYVADNRDPQQPALKMVCDRDDDGRMCAYAPGVYMATWIADLLNAAEADR